MGALIRNRQVISIHHDTVFKEDDHVVMFAMDKKLVSNIEETFQPISKKTIKNKMLGS